MDLWGKLPDRSCNADTVNAIPNDRDDIWTHGSAPDEKEIEKPEETGSIRNFTTLRDWLRQPAQKENLFADWMITVSISNVLARQKCNSRISRLAALTPCVADARMRISWLKDWNSFSYSPHLESWFAIKTSLKYLPYHQVSNDQNVCMKCSVSTQITN